MTNAGDGIAGIVLAGGLARRMGGGDKGLHRIAGTAILARVVARVGPQVAALALNANGDPARFATFGLPVVPDVVEGFAGPLAGVLSGMDWARRRLPDARWLVSVPTDTPFVPRDLVVRLATATAAARAALACAASGGQAHPVVGLWRIDLADDLRAALVEEGVRKIDVWTARHGVVYVDFPADPVDPFFNANTPEDLAEAERLITLEEKP
ncbi:MAG: molybdenum cofactor guanylyltransferase MobA [Alphaproteobacteria bacterium]|nr:molybdenum cofactor guanylyltransferase MobA [Alphaproteobacteria bacterium]